MEDAGKTKLTNGKSVVAVIRCDGYEYVRVRERVAEAVSAIGGMRRFVSPGERILLKPNMLAPDPPERATTTHPSVMRALASLAREAGAKVRYGDSPGFGTPDNAVIGTGIRDVMEMEEALFADFSAGRLVQFQGKIQSRRLPIANGILDCDGIINVPKLKTHGFQRITGAVKNMFGVLPGLSKGEMHVKIPGAFEFAELLLDLALYCAPRFSMLDGILAMEGNGPRGGHPRPMNVLLASTDPIALDATAARIVGLDPLHAPVLSIAAERGLGAVHEADIDIVGVPLADVRDSDFSIEHRPIRPFFQKKTAALLSRIAVPKPFIQPKACVRCGVCVTVCPTKPKALSRGSAQDIPVYDYDRCIRCYCCQELCPESAVHITKPLLRRVFDLIDGLFFR
ncbi:MAG: DUF362 domain-containing protein [Spirochaetota bacterium]